MVHIYHPGSEIKPLDALAHAFAGLAETLQLLARKDREDPDDLLEMLGEDFFDDLGAPPGQMHVRLSGEPRWR